MIKFIDERVYTIYVCNSVIWTHVIMFLKNISEKNTNDKYKSSKGFLVMQLRINF